MSRKVFVTEQSGAALVLVLWLVVLLAAVVAAFAFTARVEQLHSRSGEEQLRGGEIARSGLEYALWRWQSNSGSLPPWKADGRTYQWEFAGTPVHIRLVAESGKIDLNHADANLLSAMFVQAGEAQERAQRLAAAVIDWRDDDDLPQPVGGAERGQYLDAGLSYSPANTAFTSVGELQRVLGMHRALFQMVEPWVTVWSDRLQPDPDVAPDAVLRAMGLDPSLWLARREKPEVVSSPIPSSLPVFNPTGEAVSIESRAMLAEDRQVWLRAVVRTGAMDTTVGPAYVVLHWQQGIGAR